MSRDAPLGLLLLVTSPVGCALIAAGRGGPPPGPEEQGHGELARPAAGSAARTAPRNLRGVFRSWRLLLGLLAVLVGACGPALDAGSVTTSPMTTSPVTTGPVTTSPPTTSPVTSAVTTSVETVRVPARLERLPVTMIRVGDRSLLVAVAETPADRATGLMLVEDLGDLAGMLFVFEEEREGSFWMKDTRIPLDIAWFDAAGMVVGTATMSPCEAEVCERYDPGASYRYAVEAPAGALGFITPSTLLVFP